MIIILSTTADGRVEFRGLPCFFEVGDTCDWRSGDGVRYDLDFIPPGVMDPATPPPVTTDVLTNVVAKGPEGKVQIIVLGQCDGGPTLPIKDPVSNSN